MRSIAVLSLIILFGVDCGKSTQPDAASVETKQNPKVLCEVCEKPIADGKAIVLTSSGKEHLFRCPNCALTYGKDLDSFFAVLKSGVYEKVISVQKKGDDWQINPATGVVFLAMPEYEGECIDRHKIFINTDEFELYLKENEYLKDFMPSPVYLDELLQSL